jgi:hypothetical protein
MPRTPSSAEIPKRARLELAPSGFAVTDLDTGKTHTVEEIAGKLPWRDSMPYPTEPKMPQHQYCVVNTLAGKPLYFARLLEFLIDKHPAGYRAYFRGYQSANRYLEIGTTSSDYRYWRTSWRPATWFINRARLNSCEPPRRVDEGAKAIPLDDWASHPWYPRGYWGEWRKRNGEWIFLPEKPKKKPRQQKLFE